MAEVVQIQGWEARLRHDSRGKLQASLHNACLLLAHHRAWQGVLAWDDFAGRLLKRSAPPYAGGSPGEWRDVDTARTRVWLSAQFDTEFAASTIEDAVLVVAHDHAFHPVREYLDGLEWDGTPRVRSWLATYLGVGNASTASPEVRYAEQVGTWWMISAVARVRKPGCKADHVLILEGLQGLGKSSALATLAGPWFLDTPINLNDKDSYQQIRGKWIVELAELDSLNKAEATRAKAFFSASVDTYRPSYGRHAIDHERQCVFAGTTNQGEYLRDQTGNRRFWPVRCHWAELEDLALDRDQLWAEADALYLAGERWWPSRDESDLLAAHQASRTVYDPWIEVLASKLSTSTQPKVCMRELFELLEIEPGRRDERAMAIRIGRCMHELGWERVQASTRAERREARFWYVRPVDEPEDGEQPA